jgi:hypothetical protein
MVAPTTTLAPAAQTTAATQCVTGWSAWINNHHPDTGDGDYELMTSSELAAFCPGGTITHVDCMTVDNIEYFSSGEILTCDANNGLVCNNGDNFPVPCSDYKIRYQCQCGESPQKKIHVHL